MTLIEWHWIVQNKLDDISKNLGEARVDKHEDARRRKKQEIVENFKRLYKGVYDRIINMCHPIHQRYNIAVTKLLGKYMEAIVVDTEETARHCIQYLKEQMLEPETFLPLNYLKVSFSFINILELTIIFRIWIFPKTKISTHFDIQKRFLPNKNKILINFDFSNFRCEFIELFVDSGETVEGTPARHQRSAQREAALRRSAVRSSGNQKSRPLRHQQCSGLRNSRRCHEGRLRNGRRCSL